MIVLQGVSKSFRDGSNIQKVINDVSINIKENDYITMKGRSGSGKTTLLNMMSLLMEPTQGRIILDEDEIIFKNEKKLIVKRRANIGLIFQSPNLISCLNPIENIIMASHEANAKTVKKRAKELLDEVDLTDKYYNKISSLSGGEAQRVAIVRALINGPKYLFCDEPTGALDSDSSEQIIRLLENIRKKNKCTLIIVTHDNKLWERGETKLLIKEGKIHEME